MMENDGRSSNYTAAALGSKSANLQTPESVLDNWEEAAQDAYRSQELERSIEEKLGKMKQKQSGVPDTTANHSNANEDRAYYNSTPPTTESRSAADLTSSGPTPTIRILKRPQSSGHLPQQGQQHQQQPTNSSDQSKPSPQIAASSNGGRPQKNGSVGRSTQQQQRTLEERAAAYAEARMRIFGVADQQIHDDLPVQPKLSTMPSSNQSSPGSNADR